MFVVLFIEETIYMEVQLEEMSYTLIRKTENTTQWGNLFKCGASRTPSMGRITPYQ